MTKTLVALTILTLVSFTTFAQSTTCDWREREVTITILGNDELWLNCDVTAFTCDSEGKPSNYGNYVIIKNRGKEPFYYRSSPPNTYENPNAKTFQRGTTSNANYLPIGVGSSRIIDVVDYRNQKDKYLPTHAVVNVKYCKPVNKPTQGDRTTLEVFKENQKQYITNVKDCGDRYYFAYIRARYGPSLLVTCSEIFKTSAPLEEETLVDIPRSTNYGDFSKQTIISDIKYATEVDGNTVEFSPTSPRDSGVHIVRFSSKDEAVSKRNDVLNEAELAPKTKKIIDNSIFIFNNEIVCQEN